MHKCFNLISFSILLLSGCRLFLTEPSDALTPTPTAVKASDVKSYVDRVPSHTRFGYGGLSFYRDRLYVATNIGLLEIQDGEALQLLKWANSDDVVDSVWNDREGQTLWLYHSGLEKFVRHDGSQWSFVERGTPEKGFYDRGDALNGFTAFSSESGFWVQGASTVWKWDNPSGEWNRIGIPGLKCEFDPEQKVDQGSGCFAGIAPLNDGLILITHGEYFSDLGFSPGTSTAPRHLSDRVFLLENNEWIEVPNESDVDFLSKDVVATPSAAYVSTYYKTLFRITRSDIAKIEIPGEIEAMTATTSNGNLLVSFKNLGIYEYQNGWQKRFDCPYPATEPEHFAHIAENNGKIAFAISSVPVTEERFPLPSRHIYPGQTTLWVSDENVLKLVKLFEN